MSKKEVKLKIKSEKLSFVCYICFCVSEECTAGPKKTPYNKKNLFFILTTVNARCSCFVQSINKDDNNLGRKVASKDNPCISEEKFCIDLHIPLVPVMIFKIK